MATYKHPLLPLHNVIHTQSNLQNPLRSRLRFEIYPTPCGIFRAFSYFFSAGGGGGGEGGGEGRGQRAGEEAGERRMLIG